MSTPKIVPDRYSVDFRKILGDLLKSLPPDPWLKQSLQFFEAGYSQPEILFLHLAAAKTFLYQRDHRFPGRALRRGFDLLVSMLGLVIALPIILIAAALIKIESPGPVFFRQLRVGKNFSAFNIFKLRTMVHNAEALQLRMGSHRPMTVYARDPRSTRVGHLCRKYKIDELPQLINVLKGEMSIVGPRPLSFSDSSTCPLRYLIRFAEKPGITGLWQAFRPNTINGLSKFRMDSYYCRKSDILFDLYLCFKTIGRVAKGEGPKARNLRSVSKPTRKAA